MKLLLITLLSFFSYAQSNYNVTYHLNSIGEPETESVLFINDSIKNFEILDKRIKENEPTISNIEKTIQISNFKVRENNRRTIVKNNRIYTYIDISKKWFTINEEIPTYNWKITNTNKNIAGYNCILANMVYKNKNYIAYFTPEINISEGPWKFNGLPGLILELICGDVDFHFIVSKIIKNPNEFPIINLKDFQNGITYEIYKRNVLEYLKNQKSFMESIAASHGGRVETNFHFQNLDYYFHESEIK